MEYRETVRLKDGRLCLLRNGTAQDAQASLALFVQTHEETDYLLSYADEITFTAEQQAEYLKEKAESGCEIEILAELDGAVVGMAGIEAVGKHEKTRHRAGFGVSVARAYWGLGIGRALIRACIGCAARAGYAQLELEAVAENRSALALYESEGFTEYGRNPRGFRSRLSGFQTLVLMRRALDPTID